MTKIKIIFAVLLAMLSANFANGATIYDLSTPQNALESIIKADSVGTWAAITAVYSKKSISSGEILLKAMNKSVQDSVRPTTPFDRFEVVREDQKGDRAVLYVKVWYSKEWIKKDSTYITERGLEKSVNDEDGKLVNADGSKEFFSELGPFMSWQRPYQKDGVGYTVYFLKKEEGVWKFVTGTTFRTSINPMKYPLYKKFLDKTWDVK